MSIVKKEARLSGMLLARKGAALPAHTDHRLNMQAFEQAEIGFSKVEVKSEKTDSSMLAEAVKEINKVTKRQYNEVVKEENMKVKPATSKQSTSEWTPVNKKPVGAGKRIAMTLRMEQEEHLKLRLYAAHSRKSCQEIISEALEQYLTKDKSVCGLSDCNCLTKNNNEK